MKIYNNPKKLAVTAMILLAVSLIPLFIVSHYNVPNVDDFWHGRPGYEAWKNTGSLLEVARAGADWSVYQYNNWGGIYTHGGFISFAAPVTLEHHWIVGYTAILSLVLSVIFLGYVIMRKLFDAEFWTSVLIAVVAALCVVWTVPSIAESFFWKSAAFTYTIAMALFFSVLALTVLMCCSKSKSKRFKIFYVIFTSLAVVFYSGLNMITSFGSATLLLMLTALLFVMKNKAWKLILLPAVLGLACCLITITAPGNEVRRELNENQNASKYVSTIRIEAFYGDHDMSPREYVEQNRHELILDPDFLLDQTAVGAVFNSLIFALEYPFFGARVFFVYFLVFLLLPLFIEIAKNAKLSFRYPVIVSVFSYLWLASLATPTFYSQGRMGCLRVQGIYASIYVFLVLINMIYWLGWFMKQHELHKKLKIVRPGLLKLGTHAAKTSLVLAFAFSFWFYNYGVITAVHELLNGDVATYSREWHKRYEILRSGGESVVVFEPLTVEAESLHFLEFCSIDGVFGAQVARFFAKESICSSCDGVFLHAPRPLS
jgi:hypothetical protein